MEIKVPVVPCATNNNTTSPGPATGWPPDHLNRRVVVDVLDQNSVHSFITSLGLIARFISIQIAALSLFHLAGPPHLTHRLL